MPAFTFELPVRYGAIDYARVVYYPQFLHFCHVTKEAMFDTVAGLSYPELLIRDKVGYPTVKSNADFKAPVAYGETLRMSMRVRRIGTSSVDFRYEGVRTSDDALAFRVDNTEVCIDMDAWTSTPIPDAHRAIFEGLQEA